MLAGYQASRTKDIQSLIEARATKPRYGFGLVVADGNAPPVFERAEQSLDEIAPAVFGAIVRDGYAAIVDWDDRLATA